MLIKDQFSTGIPTQELLVAWRRLPNGKFNFRTMFMAAFAKPLLCAGRIISTKFNLKTK
jgi:hypothetical protein